MTTLVSVDQTVGDLTLHTGRAGLLSAVGHDLTLVVRAWSAQATVEDDGAVTALRLVAQLRSLCVLRGEGGLKPLSDKDRANIIDNAMKTLKAKLHPELVFEARDLQLRDGEAELVGTVEVAGRTGSQVVQVNLVCDSGTVHVVGRGDLLQSAFGITPYSAMLGQLRVRDLVRLSANVTVAAP